MSYQSDEEQVEKLKEMWKRHGMPLLTGVALALAGTFGWQGWNNYQDGLAANASALYQNMLESTLESEGVEARSRAAALAEQLRADYPKSRYAGYAALMQARLAVEADDLDAAEKLLREAAAFKGDPVLKEVASQRLARVLGELSRAEEGLALLSGDVRGELLAGREEVRGDLLLQLERTDEARAAYQAAIAAVEDPRARPQLQLKLDDLAEEVL